MGLQDRAFKHFETVAGLIGESNPQKTLAALSAVASLVPILDETAAWSYPTLDLVREDETARTFLEELLCLIECRKKIVKHPELKMSTLNELVQILLFHHQHFYFFRCEGELAECLRAEISEKEALDYYFANVVGAVQDASGRRVFIRKKAQLHLYKDNEGKHYVASEYFQQHRAHRLPWVRHVIMNSTEVYTEAGGGRHGLPDLVYVGHTVLGKESYKYPQAFVVIVEFNRSRIPSFLTAFHVSERKAFLKLLAGWRKASSSH